MAVFMSGDDEQIALVADYAEELGVPTPRPVTKTAATRTLDWLKKSADGVYRTLDARNFGAESGSASVKINVREVPTVAEYDSSERARYWRNIQSFQSSQSSLALLYSSLDDQSESVRVAAASALFLLHDLPNERVRAVLERGADSNSDLVSEMAQAALLDRSGEAGKASMPGAYDADSNGARELHTPADEEVSRSDLEAPETVSLVVHGTFARLVANKDRWYDPMAALPKRLRSEANPDLYLGVDYFRWSAGYSDALRAAGARKLIDWCKAHGGTRLGTVYAHSHGGNVVMDALEQGLEVDLLVLLHVPVLRRDSKRWATIDSNVRRVFDLRTPLDWVVLIDGFRTGSRNGFNGELSTVERPTPALTLTQSTRVSHRRYTKDKVWESLSLTSDIREQLSLL